MAREQFHDSPPIELIRFKAMQLQQFGPFVSSHRARSQPRKRRDAEDAGA
jgi:hypothetical protein